MACFLLSFVLKAKASFNINNKILGIGYNTSGWLRKSVGKNETFRYNYDRN